MGGECCDDDDDLQGLKRFTMSFLRRHLFRACGFFKTGNVGIRIGNFTNSLCHLTCVERRRGKFKE